MKILKLIALAASALLFLQCKTTAPTGPSGPAPSLLEVQQILDTTASQFLQYADSTNGDPGLALMLTANWVQSQPNVQSVATIDSTYLDIVLSSGLQADFFFNEINDSGYSIFRGGGGTQPEPSHISFHDLSKNSITNKKVLIYAPAWTEFELSTTVPQTVSTLSNPDIGLDVTVLKDESCTPDLANTFKDYGLVILDTHGLPDGYMSGSIIDIAKTNNTESLYRSAVILQLGQDVYDRILSKDYRIMTFINISKSTPNWQKRKNLKRIESVFVTTQYLKNIPSLTNTIVFGNMCYSGYSVVDPNKHITYPIRTAFLDKNPISYYCYALTNGRATAVTDPFSKDMEDSLTKSLVNDLDSTGIANLHHGDGTEFFDIYLDQSLGRHVNLLFKHFGADDYSYASCVSQFTDARDGHIYKAVCIGGQNWMAENLAFNAAGSKCYGDDPNNCNIYGRLYDWNTLMQGSSASSSSPSGVQGVCPKGWHLPSQAEWVTLINSLGGANVAGSALRSTSSLWTTPNTGATNSSGFSALPSGEFSFSSQGIAQGFNSLGNFGFWWTSTIGSKPPFPVWFRVDDNVTSIYSNDGISGVNLFSCRCVKDQ